MKTSNKKRLHEICGTLKEAASELDSIVTDEADRYGHDASEYEDIEVAADTIRNVLAVLEDPDLI